MVLAFAVCAVSAPLIWIYASRTLEVYGFFPTIIGLVLIPVTAIQFYRSRNAVQIFERGIIETRGLSCRRMLFDSVTRFRLAFEYNNGSLHMKFLLSDGSNKIAYADFCRMGDGYGEGRLHAMVQEIADCIPEDIPIEGKHAIERSSDDEQEQDHA